MKIGQDLKGKVGERRESKGKKKKSYLNKNRTDIAQKREKVGWKEWNLILFNVKAQKVIGLRNKTI